MNFHKWIRKHFGRSIVKFLIGLLILAIIASAIIYLLTQFDYSHLLPSGTDTRSYVVNSGAPLTATPTPTAFARFPEADLTAAPKRAHRDSGAHAATRTGHAYTHARALAHAHSGARHRHDGGGIPARRPQTTNMAT